MSVEQNTASTTKSNSQPVITVMHASVGSGHKAAANAVAQAIDKLRGTNGIPENVRIDVLDILDYGRIKFDGNKTAASFTGATRPIYDITWRYTLTGRSSGVGVPDGLALCFHRLTTMFATINPLRLSQPISPPRTSPVAHE